jgi:hypothetical protein
MANDADKRKVRFEGLEFEAVGLARIMKMIKEYGSESPGEFWSERDQAWKPMAGIMNDFSPSHSERLDSARRAGIQWVSVLNSGQPGECDACASLAGKRYPISEVPDLPPASCSCSPWCHCVTISVQ